MARLGILAISGTLLLSACAGPTTGKFVAVPLAAQRAQPIAGINLGAVTIAPFDKKRMRSFYGSNPYWNESLRKYHDDHFNVGSFRTLLGKRLRVSNLFASTGGEKLNVRAEMQSVEDRSRGGPWAYDNIVVTVRYFLSTLKGEAVADYVVKSNDHDETANGKTRAIRSIKKAWNKNVESLIATLSTKLPTQLIAFNEGRKQKIGAEKNAGRYQSVQAGQPTGIYRLGEAITFNILDSISLDPKTRRLSLVGHFDPRYAGPRIPYLQHLAELIESPSPEFSLEWTRQSEAKVDAFLNRMDDPAAMRRFGGSLGEWLDARGRPTALGRRMFSMIGITPAKGGGPLGYLGASVKSTGDYYLDVIRVVPGSPAARAGLRAGDSLGLVNKEQIWLPADFGRLIRRAGAGAKVKFIITRPGYKGGPLTARLGAAAGDRWAHISRFDILSMLLSKSGNGWGAQVVDSIGRFSRISKNAKKLKSMALDDLIGAARMYQRRDALSARFRRGELTASRWRALVMGGVTRGIERAFKLSSGTLTRDFQAALARGQSAGNAFTATLRAMDREMPKIGEAALRTLFNRLDEVVIPASEAEAFLGVKPEVQPRYIGLRSDTLLARTLFEADYLAKAIIEMPKLKKRIAAYETQFGFDTKRRNRRGSFAGGATERLWISIGKIDLTQSPDGHTLSVGQPEMRFNIGDASQEAMVSAKRPDGYAALLTSIYGELASEFSVLHELREAAKVAAASRWIKARWPEFRLPVSGRVKWQGPKNLPGVVYLIWAPGGKRIRIAVVGGVSLVPPIGPSGPVNAVTVARTVPIDASVVDLSKSSLIVVPAHRDNAAIRRILARKIDVPVPRPLGWVRRADKGARTLRALNVRLPAESGRCDIDTTAQLDEKLADVRLIAGQLANAERAINAITDQSPDRQAEFAGLESDLVQARQAFIDQSVELISQGLLDSRDLVRNRASKLGLGALNEQVEAMHELNGLLGGVQGKLDDLSRAWRVATAGDIEQRNAAAMELLQYARELIAKAENPGDDALGRALGTAGKVFRRLDKLKTAVDYGSNLFTLGRAALRMKTIGGQTEAEVKALRDQLLPLQTHLSDQLDQALKDPLVENWKNRRARVGC